MLSSECEVSECLRCFDTIDGNEDRQCYIPVCTRFAEPVNTLPCFSRPTSSSSPLRSLSLFLLHRFRAHRSSVVCRPVRELSSRGEFSMAHASTASFGHKTKARSYLEEGHDTWSKPWSDANVLSTAWNRHHKLKI
jgi:hypothetical protein